MTIRSTDEVLDVLEYLLAADDEVYGWMIAKATRLGPSTVYKILKRLSDEDVVVSRWEDIDDSFTGQRRRLYRITAHGETIAGQLLNRRQLFIRPEYRLD